MNPPTLEPPRREESGPTRGPATARRRNVRTPGGGPRGAVAAGTRPLIGHHRLDLADDRSVRRRAATLIAWMNLAGLPFSLAMPLTGDSQFSAPVMLSLILGHLAVVVVAFGRRDRFGDTGLWLLQLGALAVVALVLFATTPAGSLRSSELVLLVPLITACVFCGSRWHAATVVLGCVVAANAISLKRLTGQPDAVAELLGELTVFCMIAVVVRSLRESAQAALVSARVGELTDPLTELANRRGFEHAGSQLWTRRARDREGVVVMVLDLDHFKSVNDRHGHAAGDEVLHRLAQLMATGVRAGDLAARLGGEEFAVLAQVQTGEGALLAERLRQDVEAELAPVTVSIGAVELVPSSSRAGHQDVEALWQAVAQADALLYEAKRAGRNRVVMAS